MPNRKLPPDDIVDELYSKQKMHQLDIAKHYNVTRAAVSLALKRAGTKTRSRIETCRLKREALLPPIEELKELYAKMGAETIGRLYGTSGSPVRRMLEDHGVELRYHGRKLPDDDTLLNLYWDEEMSFAMIGEQYDVAASVVQCAFKARGLKCRTRTEAVRLAARRNRPPGARRTKLLPDTELLQLYWEHELSFALMAKRIGCGISVIADHFKRRRWKTRNHAEAQKARYRREARKRNANT